MCSNEKAFDGMVIEKVDISPPKDSLRNCSKELIGFNRGQLANRYLCGKTSINAGRYCIPSLIPSF